MLLGGCGGDGDTVYANTVTCPEPGASYCTGSASGVVCAEGSTSGVQFSCATGEVCEEGACTGQCEADAAECVGDNVVRTCSSDGKQWAVAACQAGQRCVEGACVDTCVAGETRCKDDKTQQICGDGGQFRDVECPTQTACSEGVCQGECVVGQVRCDPSLHALTSAYINAPSSTFGLLWTCEDGRKWTLDTCGEGEVCVYEGLSDAEVDRYRYEMLSFFEFGGSGAPRPPAIPSTLNASCVVDECTELVGESFPFIYLAVHSTGLRVCGEAGDLAEHGETSSKLSSCTGLLPYAPSKVTTVTCPDDLVCSGSNPQLGCTPPCDSELGCEPEVF